MPKVRQIPLINDINRCREPTAWAIIDLSPPEISTRLGIQFWHSGHEDGIGDLQAARLVSETGRLFTLVYYENEDNNEVALYMCRGDILESPYTLLDEFLELTELIPELITWKQDPNLR